MTILQITGRDCTVQMIRNLDINIMNDEKQYRIKGQWIFVIQLLVIGLSFSMFVNPHYSIDSYGAYLDQSINHYLSLGRIVSYVIASLLSLAGMNPVEHQMVFTILEMLFMALSASLLIKRCCLYYKDISLTKFVLINLSILISFVNIYILEWYLFPEMSYLFGLGLLLATIAVLKITEEINFRNVLYSSIFLLLSENIYQINITIFIIFSLTFLLIKDMYSITIKQLLKKVLTVASISGITMLVNTATIKLMPLIGIANPNTRIMDVSLRNLWDRFLSIIMNEQDRIWGHGSGFLENGVMGLFLLLSVTGLLFVMIDQKKIVRAASVVSIVCILFMNYLVVLLPHLLTSDLWMAPRTIVGIFPFLSSIYIIILAFPIRLKFKRIISIVLTVFLLVNYIQISKIGVNVFATNKIDREIIRMISNRIEEYENDNNQKVRKIAVAKDADPQYGYYGNVDYIEYDTNVRALAANWAVIPAINFYSHNEYIPIDMPVDIYNKYFQGKDWKCFDQNEQLIFDCDTLYMVVY